LSALIIVVISYLPTEQYSLLFTAPFCLLIASALLSLFVYRIKNYDAIQPCRFIEKYSQETLKTTLRTYTSTIAETTLKHHKIHEEKAALIKGVTLLLVLAITLFFILTLFVIS